tara:strand:- start:430 stop:564 length:135 start_codon:yes stop_codon:yes gene_type:complete
MGFFALESADSVDMLSRGDMVRLIETNEFFDSEFILLIKKTEKE